MLQAVSRQELPQHLLLLFLMPQVATNNYKPQSRIKKNPKTCLKSRIMKTLLKQRCWNTDTAFRTLDAMRVSDGPDGEAYCTNCYRQRLGENFEIEDTTIHPLLVFDGTHRACVWQVDLLLDKYVQVRGRQPQTSWGWKHNIDLGQV